MKKTLICLLSFCLVLCMMCTACAKIPPQNTDGAESTTETTAASTTQGKSYEVCWTSIRETKALATEVPELQEKIDRNYEMTYEPKVQQKVVISFADQRDVPYLFRNWHNYYVEADYIMNPTPDFSIPSISDLQSMKEFMPTYTYTGTEEFKIELNDEIYDVDEYWQYNVKSLDGSVKKRYRSLTEMYEELPRGEYYVYFDLTIYGNDIIGEYGYTAREYKTVIPSFIVELK